MSRELEQYKDFNPHYLKSKQLIPSLEEYTIADSLLELADYKLEKLYKLAGRVIYKRNFGALLFLKLHTGHDQYQLLFRTQSTLNYAQFKNLTRGDCIFVQGISGLSTTKEFTIFVKRCLLISKTLFEHPDKFDGLSDGHTILHKRYLYMLYNREFRERISKRMLMYRVIRDFFIKYQIPQIDMPILETQYGGASAAPFTTECIANKTRYYLSIAPELKLKQFIFAGYPAIYTLTHNFRNQGMSKKHHVEFSALEAYISNQNYRYAINMTKELITKIFNELGVNQIKTKEFGIIDLTKWETYTYDELLSKYYDIKASTSETKIISILETNNLPIAKSREQNCYTIFDKLVTCKLINPTCVIEYPALSTPLAKRIRANNNRIEQCEIYIATYQLANIYSEENEIIKIKQNIIPYKSAEFNADTADVNDSFVQMLGYGMPLCTGLGIGLDRVLMLATNVDDIREVLPFPLAR